MSNKNSNLIEININEFPDNVVVYRYKDNDFIFVDINENSLKTESISREDIIGHKLTEVFPGVKEFGLFDLLLKVYETGKKEKHDITFYQDDRISGWRHNDISKLSNGDIIVFYKDESKYKKTEAQLKSLGKIIDNSINEVFIFDKETLKFTYLNQRALNHIGYTFDEIKEMTPVDIKPKFTYELFISKIEPLFKKELSRLIFETIHQCKNGEIYDVEIRIELITIDEKEQFVVIANDITEFKESQKKLKEAQSELKLVARAIEQTDEMVRITDKNAVITYVNDAVIAHSGYKKVELLGKKSSIFKSGEHEVSFYKALWNTVLAGKTYKNVIVNKRKDGALYYEEQTITPILNSDQDIINFVATSHDITERIELEKQLHQLATMDSLTGVYNRYSINKSIDLEIKKYRRYSDVFSLLMIDIDFFKEINDTYGHHIGDDVLKEFSALVMKSIRETDLFGRWGGEEFMLILPKTNTQEALQVANKIRINIENCKFNGISQVTASIGVSVYSGKQTKEEILKHVDKALYEAKETGRNKVVLNQV